MLQGTFSHEPPGTLATFAMLRGRHAIHVAQRISQVALLADGAWAASQEWRFDEVPDGAQALLTCVPTVNKASIAAGSVANELQPGQPALEEALRGLDARLAARRRHDGSALHRRRPARRRPCARQFRLPMPVNGGHRHSVFVPGDPGEPGSERDAAMWLRGRRPAAPQRITSIDLMARRRLKDDMPGIMLRATMRHDRGAVLQYQAQQHATSRAGRRRASGRSPMHHASQTADDRTWRALPADVSVARGRLPRGGTASRSMTHGRRAEPRRGRRALCGGRLSTCQVNSFREHTQGPGAWEVKDHEP